MKIFFNSLNLIPKENRKNFFILVFLTFIAVIFESFGLFLVYPLIKLLSLSTYEIHSYLDLIKVKDYLLYFGFYTKEQILYFLIFIIFLLFTLKVIFQITLNYVSVNLFSSSISNIADVFYEYYLNRSLTEAIKTNSSQLVNNIFNQLNIIVNNCFASIIIIISELSIIIILIFFLSLINIKILFIFFLISIFVIIFSYIIKKNIIFLGTERVYYYSKALKNLQEGFSALSNIKIFDLSAKYLSEFAFNNRKRNYYDRKINIFNEIQKIFLEYFLLIIFLIFLIFNIKKDLFLNSIPTIAFLAAASFRILPSMHRLSLNYNKLLNSKYSINYISKELKKIKLIKKNNIEVKKNIIFDKLKIINLSYKYPGTKKLIFNKINIEIKKNEIVGIKGESGIGKTTLLNLMLGLLKPVGGKILLNNKDISLNENNWRSIVSYVPQSLHLLDASIIKNITLSLPRHLEDKKRINLAIKLAELKKFIDQLPNGLDTKIGENGIRLSAGQKQRIALARAFYRNSNVIFLDEATSALDIATESKILNNFMLIKKKVGLSLIIISHRDSTLRSCDKVIYVKKNRIHKVLRS
jgi:ABC-type multidrug transport system fused ATPase/permease subunit